MPNGLKNPNVPGERPWLMLVHQLPAKPAYYRVKIWRLLQEAGAISLKKSVYVLPASDEARATFAKVLYEIEQHHGDGLLYQAELVAGMRDDQLRALFNAARDADYHAVNAELRQMSQAWKKPRKPKGDPAQALARISQRLGALAKIDFFGASARTAAEALLARLEHSATERKDLGYPPGHSCGPHRLRLADQALRRSERDAQICAG
jgi:hypothetical protein